MPWQFEFDGQCWRDDDLTVAELERLYDGAETDPVFVARILLRLGADLAKVRALRIADLVSVCTQVESDLPLTYMDGMPSDGGRLTDRYLVFFARPPFCWPPTVTRQQTHRDLSLLLDAFQSED